MKFLGLFGNGDNGNWYLREMAADYAWEFIGVPYIWGGNNPVNGFDCEGIVSEVLEAIGLIEHNSDYTAQGLFNRFKDKVVTAPKTGCIVFFGRDIYSITHTEFCVDQFHTIGAIGGGKDTLTREDAIKQNAFVKMRPLARRKDIVAFVDPF